MVEPEPSLRADLQQALSTYIDGADTSHDLAHADRVWLNAREIASNEGCGNLRVLIAAAYLHDLVSLPKDHVDRHKSSSLSADKAAPVLQQLGYTADETTQVQHVIAAHSYSANIAPETIEAMILQDADRLDALGAIGIARTFAVSGALGRPIYDAADPFAKARQLDDRKFAIDHWPIKLLRLAALMNTDSGKALARQRVVLMKGFLTQLASELGTTLPADWDEI
ncbi:MAG: HD domain-containing protein [Marinosulfonomonas sp.]|nr:HD domain-containing protein [Marinosulfonomonas sp.]